MNKDETDPLRGPLGVLGKFIGGAVLGCFVSSLPEAELIEDYPEFPKGPCVLVLQYDRDDAPLHAVWGIPKGLNSPAVLVTAYRPDSAKWTHDFRSRRT